jgi:hypothetical protein
MNRPFLLRAIAVSILALPACGGAVRPDPGGGGSAPAGQAPPTSVSGTPCAALHGEATLANYRTSPYASSAFSFEFASQDPTLTANRFELLFEDGMFLVNMASGDASYIVDLGGTSLAAVPATVDPSAYPVGEWNEHEAIDAVLGHVYYVRSVHSSGRLVSAFVVTGLEPSKRVTIEWMRSTDPDRMITPAACL